MSERRRARTGSRKARGLVLGFAGALALAGCEATVSGNADNSVAEDACVAAVNANAGSRGAMVMASEASATGTRVMVLSGGGQTWNCSATNAGVVESVSAG